MFEDWNYYAIIPVTGSSDGAKTDYQVEITVPYDSRMKSDFGDIRFSNYARDTALDYCFISQDNGVEATFLVKIPSLPASPTVTNIKVLCGNATATTTSDPESTYDYYQDFSGDSTPDVEYNPSGIFKSGWDNGDARFDAANNRIIVYDGTSSGGSIKLKDVDVESGFKLRIGNVNMPDEALFINFYESNAQNHSRVQYVGYTTDDWLAYKVISNSGTLLTSNSNASNGLDGSIELLVTPSSILLEYNNNTVLNYAGTLPVADGVISIAAGGGGVGTYCYITGEISLSKHTANSPTVGSSGEWIELNPKTDLKTLFEVIRPYADLKTIFQVRPYADLKTLFEVIRPYADLKTIFKVVRSDNANLKTFFCIRRPYVDLKTLFTTKLFTDTTLQTIFTVKRNIVTHKEAYLKTLFRINDNSNAIELKTIFFVNGSYIKSIKLHGTILESERRDNKRKGNNYVKIIIGDEIYV